MVDVLKETGAQFDFYDPWVPEYKEHGTIHKGIKEINPEIIKGYDLVMVTTAHTNVDYEMVQENAIAIFDTKNALKNLKNRDNIEVL